MARTAIETVEEDGARVVLHGRDEQYDVEVDGRIVLATDRRQAEQALAELALAPWQGRDDITVLVGGLGAASAPAAIRASSMCTAAGADPGAPRKAPCIARRAVVRPHTMNILRLLWASGLLAVLSCGKATAVGTDGGGAAATVTAPSTTAAGSGQAAAPTAAGGDIAGVTAVTDCPKSLSGSEKAARTITKACGPVLVTGDYSVDGQLTLEAGAVLKFNEGTTMIVGDNATSKLIVKGTAQDPVLLTSAGDPVAGFWHGVNVSTHAARSQIENLVIEHAGDNYGAFRIRASDVTVKGLIIRDAKEIGFYVDDGVTIAALSGATFEKAGKIAASIGIAAIPAFVPGQKFEAGAIVEVRGGDVDADAKWQNPGAPYVFRRNFGVRGKGRVKLEIAAGTELRFDKDGEVDVGYDGLGAVIVSGTADKPVVFTAADADAPWKGIWIYQGGDASFTSATFTNAGVDDHRGAIFATDGGSLSVTGVTLKGKGLGIIVEPTGKLKSLDKTTFEAGDKPALVVPSDAVAALGTGNTFPVGSHIHIKGGKLKTTATWAPQPVPYEVEGELVVDEKGVLTLQAGVELVFEKDQQMSIGYSGEGSLKALGTADKPVKLHGGHDEPDAWKGLILYEGARDCELTNVRIAGAGGDAGVVVRDNAIVKIDSLTCAKCTTAAVTSGCNAKLKVAPNAIKIEGGTPKDLTKPEGCP